MSPAPPPPREYKRLGFTTKIAVTEDKLECRCSYLPHSQGTMMTLDELRSFLTDASISDDLLDSGAVDEFAIRAAAGQTLNSVVLATGIPPQNGADGWLSYIAQPSVVVQQGNDDTTEIDFHQVQSFINVLPDEEIARIIPPDAGAPGTGVTGITIPQVPGTPLNIKLGKNIRTEDDGALLIAQAAGRVCLVGGELSVEEEYIVSGDVNFRIGSIVFNGIVEIRGEVLDDFSISASKGLRVSGNIGKCHISSEGDISFCGMDGQEEGVIRCGGTLSAHYLHNCTVECAGDILVEAELHNCTIKTLGRIVVNKGTICGGSYIALGGIEAKKVGSPTSVYTSLSAGLDYGTVEELEYLFSELASNRKKTAATNGQQELAELQRIKDSLTRRIMELRNTNDNKSNPKVNIKGILYENTLLYIGKTHEKTSETRNGPFSIIENTIDGGLRFLPMTGLNVKASDMEQAILMEKT